MNPFKPKRNSNKGKPKANKIPRRAKVCHWCKRRSARLAGTPKGWKWTQGHGWACPDCVEEHPEVYKNE